MTGNETGVRLRQAVLVAAELEPLVDSIREALGSEDPFRDPGVAEFGLVNAVFAIGDCFPEIVTPDRQGTAAGRQIERNGGDGGYMVLFDLRDLDAARARAEQGGVRVVWQIDLPDISGTHMHPADLRGAIVSLDASRPYGTWRWGGPLWTERTDDRSDRPAGELRGITVAVAEPAAVAARWGEVLGVPLAGTGSDSGPGAGSGPASEPVLALDGAEVRFQAPRQDGREGIVEIHIAVPAAVRNGRETLEAGSARLKLSDLGA